MRVQRRHRQRGQANEEEIRKHHTREQDGELHLSGVVGEAGRNHPQEPGRRGDPQDCGHRQGQQRGRSHRPQHADELVAGPGGHVIGEDGHQGCGQGAFGQQPAQHVGDAEGDEEGIGNGPGAEGQGHHHVAYEAKHPTGQGGHADASQRPHDLAFDGHDGPFPPTPAREGTITPAPNPLAICRGLRQNSRVFRKEATSRWPIRNRRSNVSDKTKVGGCATEWCARGCGPR